MSARDALLSRAVTWFAANGVGDTSLRTLAHAIGTSHRMLHYHFGSRAGLLAAVVESVERSEREVLDKLLSTDSTDPYAAGRAFWLPAADSAQRFGPLFFELAGHAMQDQPHARDLGAWLATGWSDALTHLFIEAGHPPQRAAELARLSLAMARGLLFELLLTGDRAAIDAATDHWVELLRSSYPVDQSPRRRTLTAMTPSIAALHTATAASTGDARNGHVQSSDSIIDLDVRAPKEMGGSGGATNPEQLFAAGYAACFHSALKLVATRSKADTTDSEVVADVSIGDNGAGGFGLAVELEVTLPALDRAVAQDLVEQAHQVCPYSNATRGNIEVTLTVS